MAGGVGGGVVFNPHKRYFEVYLGGEKEKGRGGVLRYSLKCNSAITT